MHPRSGIDPQVTVKIRCRLGWMLLQEYDNTGNTNTTINHTVQGTQSKEASGTDYIETVNKSSRKKLTSKLASFPVVFVALNETSQD